VDPAQVIADQTPQEKRAAASAPEAAHWLANPAEPARQISQADELAAEPEWTGPDYEDEEQEEWDSEACNPTKP
jgi:hypothetical protein